MTWLTVCPGPACNAIIVILVRGGTGPVMLGRAVEHSGKTLGTSFES